MNRPQRPITTATKTKKKKSKPTIIALPPYDPAQRYNIIEASAYLRKSRSTLYEDIKSGKLRVIQDGGRVFVPGSEIARLSSLAG